MWKNIERTAHRLGFTRNEAAVILFLVGVLLAGQAIGMLNDEQTRQTDFKEEYRQYDMVFAARSSEIPVAESKVSDNKRNMSADGQSSLRSEKSESGRLNIVAEPLKQQTQITEVININRATASELEQLPGVGPVTAQRIIDYREQKEPFSAVEDIMNVKSIGPKKFEKLRTFICTE